jgi:hypothetical protein
MLQMKPLIKKKKDIIVNRQDQAEEKITRVEGQNCRGTTHKQSQSKNDKK